MKVEGLLENKDEMVLYFQIHGVLPAVQRGCGAKGCQHSDSSERVYFPTIFFFQNIAINRQRFNI